MNKQQAIRAVATRAEVDEPTTRRVLETFFDVVVREVAAEAVGLGAGAD